MPKLSRSLHNSILSKGEVETWSWNAALYLNYKWATSQMEKGPLFVSLITQFLCSLTYSLPQLSASNQTRLLAWVTSFTCQISWISTMSFCSRRWRKAHLSQHAWKPAGAAMSNGSKRGKTVPGEGASPGINQLICFHCHPFHWYLSNAVTPTLSHCLGMRDPNCDILALGLELGGLLADDHLYLSGWMMTT